MSTFWIIYFITLGAIFLLSVLLRVFFTLDGDEIPFAYLFLSFFLSAIPAANILVGVVLIVMIIIAVCDEDLEAKF